MPKIFVSSHLWLLKTTWACGWIHGVICGWYRERERERERESSIPNIINSKSSNVETNLLCPNNVFIFAYITTNLSILKDHIQWYHLGSLCLEGASALLRGSKAYQPSTWLNLRNTVHDWAFSLDGYRLLGKKNSKTPLAIFLVQSQPVLHTSC